MSDQSLVDVEVQESSASAFDDGSCEWSGIVVLSAGVWVVSNTSAAL